MTDAQFNDAVNNRDVFALGMEITRLRAEAEQLRSQRDEAQAACRGVAHWLPQVMDNHAKDFERALTIAGAKPEYRGWVLGLLNSMAKACQDVIGEEDATESEESEDA